MNQLLEGIKKIFTQKSGTPVKVKLGIKGSVRLIGSNYDKDGVLRQVFDRTYENLITYAGFDLMFDCLGKNAQPSDITHMAIGSGAVGNISDTTLTTEDQRETAAFAHTPGQLTCTFTSTFTVVVASTEYGLFNAGAAGSMFNTAGYDAVTIDSMQVIGTLTFSDVG